MGKNKKEAQQEIPAHMVCDEGGTHDFRFAKEVGCCDRCTCIFCFPCYAICSCLMSEGAAFANPLFEQMCCSKGQDQGEDAGKAVCRKCGLTEIEARDLSDARGAEAQEGKRTTGYFSNAMSMPGASTSNQTPVTSPVHPTNPDQIVED